jgi:hypothetical protein
MSMADDVITLIGRPGPGFFQFNLDLLRHVMKEVKSLSPPSVRFLFGGNPWSCDCETVNETKEFLRKYKKFFRDAEHLTCQGDQVYMRQKLVYNCRI